MDYGRLFIKLLIIIVWLLIGTLAFLTRDNDKIKSWKFKFFLAYMCILFYAMKDILMEF